MRPIEIKSSQGSLRVFSTNYGPHTPELMAEMSMHQLIAEDSHPIKAAEVRQALVDLYAQAQLSLRKIFKHARNENDLMCAINQILVRDLATALDIERQFHKE